jgi:hypothetical protein
MTKFQSLVQLIHSMTIAEKKAFRIKSLRKKSAPDYMVLYNIIEQGPDQAPSELKVAFLNERPSVTFETTVKYLLEILLDTMLELRKEQDSFFSLFNKILKAKILFEKSLYDECFELLHYVILQAEKYENYYAMLLAGRLEIEYQMALNFPNLSEKELLKKQFNITESLKYLRKVNEQSSLYEILKHRVVYKGYARSQKQKNELNDLVFSELSIVASFAPENFEISKLHQLFQSNYLISVGDYKSALRSYYELNNLFEANKHLWNTPPVYYLLTVEGVLESLRSIHNYEGMVYFIDQLKKLSTQSVDFRTNLTCIIYLYELFPLIDHGNFSAAALLMDNYNEKLYEKLFSLSRARQAELCLYTSLIHFGNSSYQKAHKFLSQIIIRGKTYYYLPLYRTIRLVNLMILYQLGDFDLIRYEIRSIKRDLSVTEKGYKIERFLLRFLLKKLPAVKSRRQELWEKVHKEFDDIQHDVFEQQVLRIFDFTAWVESLIKQVPLSEVLHNRIEIIHENQARQ